MIKTIHGKINIIEDYISKDTADYLCDVFSKDLNNTPREKIFAGPSVGKEVAHKIGISNPIIKYTNDTSKNIAIDLLSMICSGMADTLSNYYNKDIVLKSVCYNHMLPGAINPMHADNEYFNDNGELEPREDQKFDKSGILYLNEEYEGGVLNFPEFGFSIKPKAGTFIFFEGNSEVMHEVTEVTSGNRVNLVSFFWPKRFTSEIL